MGDLPGRASDLVQNQPQRGRGVVAVNKTGRSWRSEECFDIKHGDAEFGGFHAGFQARFGLVFPHYNPFLPFWSGCVYSVSLYVQGMLLLYFIGVIVRRLP